MPPDLPRQARPFGARSLSISSLSLKIGISEVHELSPDASQGHNKRRQTL